MTETALPAAGGTTLTVAPLPPRAAGTPRIARTPRTGGPQPAAAPPAETADRRLGTAAPVMAENVPRVAVDRAVTGMPEASAVMSAVLAASALAATLTAQTPTGAAAAPANAAAAIGRTGHSAGPADIAATRPGGVERIAGTARAGQRTPAGRIVGTASAGICPNVSAGLSPKSVQSAV